MRTRPQVGESALEESKNQTLLPLRQERNLGFADLVPMIEQIEIEGSFVFCLGVRIRDRVIPSFLSKSENIKGD